VDCNYWPEAQDALINALRADRNVCVRLEAALVLNRGCCCTRPIIMALVLTVSGGTDDGNPAEDCERVKMAAFAALEHCLECYVEVVPAPVKVPEGGEDKPKVRPELPGQAKGGPGSTGPVTTPAEYYRSCRLKTTAEVVLAARKAVEKVHM